MRLIKDDDVKDLLNGLDSLPWEEEVDHLVDSLPTVDAVPVVRCKECTHRVEHTKMCAHPDAYGWDALETDDEGFCYRGERRRGDGQV